MTNRALRYTPVTELFRVSIGDNLIGCTFENIVTSNSIFSNIETDLLPRSVMIDLKSCGESFV